MAGYGGLLHYTLSMEFALQSILRSIDGCVESRIARTAHSTVYCVKSGLYKRLVAVKMINVNTMPKSVAEKFLPRELLFTQIVRHPHIARAISIRIPHPTKIAIISEYYSGGTLLHLILRRKRIPEFPHACRLFRQLTEAVHYLHDRGVVHRDIKAENVLLDSNGDVKLVDFGFARYINQKERSKSFCGTKPYSAPEIVQHRPYDAYASDWYAMGVLLYTMLTGKWPHDSYENDKRVSNCMIFSRDIPSRAARTLILCLMNEDYRFRGTYNTILNSEWMKTYNKWLIADKHFTYEVTRTS
ncbi:CAMK protein kinase [Loa loa]|uniref:CAMK protein kinase n=2 Tax=Loa loa TaxID=7209 RepID=A0A1S0TY85_LOALO|nr:CAMK protein kinase [Loa loa]EFO21400.1 CAMK protein kinase [Loa loa]